MCVYVNTHACVWLCVYLCYTCSFIVWICFASVYIRIDTCFVNECLCVYLCMCMSVILCVPCTRMYICVVYICFVRIWMYLLYVCVCVCVCVCACVCMSLLTHLYCMCMYVCMWVFVLCMHVCFLGVCVCGRKLLVCMFANGPGDRGSIPGRVIPKTLKMVLDAALLNTQHYKVKLKGKVEQSKERSSALSV